MHIIPTVKIKIDEYLFRFCNDLQVNNSWENFTDTAKFTIPKKLNLQGDIYISADSLFKIGQRVEIEAGYNHKNNVLFKGYITDVKTKLPFTIECQDYMWLLKKSKVEPKTFPKVSLAELIDYILKYVKESKYYPAEGIKVEVNLKIENLGDNFRIPHAKSGTELLKFLKDKYGVVSYFKGNVLHVGVAYLDNPVEKEIKFNGGQVLSEDLIFRKEEDFNLNIKATSVNTTTNKKTTVIYRKFNGKIEKVDKADEDSELRHLFYQNLTETDLSKIVEKDIDKMVYSGFSGHFTTYGKPFLTHGDAVKLVDKKLPERNGTYLIKKVERSSSESGYRQKIYLDKKIL